MTDITGMQAAALALTLPFFFWFGLTVLERVHDLDTYFKCKSCCLTNPGKPNILSLIYFKLSL